MSSEIQDETGQVRSFEAVEQVIADDLKFKARLQIGADAYNSLKFGRSVSEVWDVGGAAATGAGIAASSTVASTFFSGTGLLALVTTAATPVGWIAAAAVASGGAYYGVTRLFRSWSKDRVTEIPKFINTPVDLLGASLFDLMGALSLKVADIDGNIDPAERQAIRDYFVEGWGYDPDYATSALELLEANNSETRLSDMTTALADFVESNPDCRFQTFRKEISEMLTEVAQADGKFDEREEMAIERVMASLDEQRSIKRSLVRGVSGVGAAATSAGGWIGRKIWRGRTET